MSARRLLVIGAALIGAAVLFVLLRPEDEASQAPINTTTAAATQAGSAPPPPLPPAAPQPPPPARVRIVVRDGQAVGGIRRVTIAKGRRVILVVTADVTDHVHLHGYDIQRDVAPGKPARLSFRATIVGAVEVELEERGLPIAMVTTKP